MRADTLRIATFAAPLSRDGPGLLLRDILRGEDEQLAAIAGVIRQADPDILVLTNFDHDAGGTALSAFCAMLDIGLDHRLALRPNSGLATGVDLDGNGRPGEARDAMGYGRFAGDGGLAILSRHAFGPGPVQDLSDLLWRDLPDATLPLRNGAPFPSPEAQAIQRLSSTAHWIVPVDLPGGPLTLMAWSATPPAFDGPERANILRNRDELLLWSHVLDGKIAGGSPDRFVVIGNANLDPVDGGGETAAMAAFLADPRLIDTRPASAGGAVDADPDHRGDPALDTADWPDGAPGNLRVSYILPSAELGVRDAGVFWPAPDDPGRALIGADGLAAGPHRLVWVDLVIDQGP